MIHFPCTNPGCGKVVKAPDGTAGEPARCPSCGAVQRVPGAEPSDVEHGARGPAVGAGTSAGQTGAAATRGARAMSRDCAKALAYGASNIKTIARLVFWSLVLWTLLQLFQLLMWAILNVVALGSVAPYIALARALAIVMLGGSFLRFYLDCVTGSLDGLNELPDVPEFELRESFRMGLKGLAVLLIYVVPVLTIPLLPVGLLALGYTADARGFNVLRVGRAAVKRPGALALLWLFLLVWGAALVAGCGLVVWLFRAMAAGLLSGQPGFGSLLLTLSTGAVATVALAVVFHTFVVAMFRCIAMFGRHCPDVLDVLIGQPTGVGTPIENDA